MKKRKRKKNMKSLWIYFCLILMTGLLFFFHPNYIIEKRPSTLPTIKEEEFNFLVLVNSDNEIPENYNPKLIPFDNVKVSSHLLKDLEEMIKEAKEDNVELKINNAYRSKEEQQKIFSSKQNEYIKKGFSKEDAYKKAKESVQEPGFSEHETGLAIDFSTNGNYNKNLTMWKWLKKNAHKYGFILRYPEEKVAITKIKYEPWHYRYVGRDNASIIFESNLSLEEYLLLTN